MHHEAGHRRAAAIDPYTPLLDYSIQIHRSNLFSRTSTAGGMADLGERGARKPPWSQVQVPPATSKTLMTTRPFNRPGNEGFSDCWAQLGLEGSFCLSSCQTWWHVVLFYLPPLFLVDHLGAKMATLQLSSGAFLTQSKPASSNQQSTEMKHSCP